MRLILSTVVGLGAVIGAATTSALAAAAPGAAKVEIPNVSQVEKVHRRGGGFGIYIGPGYGGYYPYYGSRYYDDYDYYPRYRYRRWGHRHYGHGHRGYRHHRHYRRHRH